MGTVSDDNNDVKVDAREKEKLQVEKVEGEKEAKYGQKVEYKATSNIDEEEEKEKIAWAVKVDGKLILWTEKGETVTITMEKEWGEKEIIVMAKYSSGGFDENVSQKTKVEGEIVARGKVYFDKEGKEIACVKSNTEFETWVESETGQGTVYNSKHYEKAIMPKIINNPEQIKRHKVYYQQYDHEIAALTHLFNRRLNADKETLKEQKIFPLQYTGVRGLFKLPIFNSKVGSAFVGGGSYTIMPSGLNPTLVKAICMRESRCNIGKGTKDIMQVNNTGDWVDTKTIMGLSKGTTPNTVASIKAGILWLYAKGIMNAQKYYIKNLVWAKGGWDYQPAQYKDIVSTLEKNSAELNIFSWKKSSTTLATGAIDSDWQFATREYNGSPEKEAYIKAVDAYYKEATVPKASDYYVDNENYIIP